MNTNVGNPNIQNNVQINSQQIQTEAQVQSSWHPTINPFIENVIVPMNVGSYGDNFGRNDKKKLEESNASQVDIFTPEDDDNSLLGLVAKGCDFLLKLFDAEDKTVNNPFKEITDVDQMLDIIGSVNGKISRKGKGVLMEYINTNKALDEGFISYTA